MRTAITILMIAGSLCLFGCKDEKEVKTVQWYREHPAELQKQYALCRDNPGQLKDDPNCINAMQARMIDSGGNSSEKPRTALPQ